jgi:hypothetical protein
MTLNIILAAVAVFIIGFVWYGPLFGKLWMKLNKLSKKQCADGKKNMPQKMGAMIVSILIMAYVLNTFVSGSISAALTTGFLIWLGFYATNQLSPVLWKGTAIKAYLLDIVYTLVMIEAAAVILVLI